MIGFNFNYLDPLTPMVDIIFGPFDDGFLSIFSPDVICKVFVKPNGKGSLFRICHIGSNDGELKVKLTVSQPLDPLPDANRVRFGGN